jgi:NADH-quinone oxidoreductase subunit F
VDLRLLPDTPTDTERAAVDAVVPAGLGADGERRDLLLPAFHAVMDAVGWISRGALGHVCSRLGVPPAEAYGVATFYALFSVTPRAPQTAHVCDDVGCAAFGGEALCAALEERLGPPGAREDVTWTRSPCLGMCERAPAVFLQRADPDADTESPAHAQIAPADVTAVLEGLGGEDVPGPDPVVSTPQAGDAAQRSSTRGDGAEGLHLLARVGVVDPADLDSYRAAGGYAGLRRALAVGPARVVDEITVASLTGRGGAAFPTGTKWAAVAGSPEPQKYLIVNADESEPGTFKDRVLMEADPFALVEAMTVAGIAVGARTGYLYIRGEYPAAERAVRAAVETARHHRLLGEDVMGSGRVFDLEVRRGAGAYICGEETALMNSLEGRRGEPRAKPPFPTVSGLFGKPTVINNVETLINVLRIVTEGGPEFASVGSGRSTGSKLFCLAGTAVRPGVYEVDMGTTLRELLELAGGVPPGLRAILLGGAAGSFVTPEQLDVPLTLEGTREIGATLGSGVVLCFSEETDFAPVLRRIAGFFRDESCGQCVPCRVGTVRQEEALARIVRGREIGGRVAELQLLNDVDRVMTDASICGLGQTAASAVRSALKLGLVGASGATGSNGAGT